MGRYPLSPTLVGCQNTENVQADALRPLPDMQVENLLNVRQTDYDSLVRPVPGIGGRWKTDVWAPLEGFMANVALRYRW